MKPRVMKYNLSRVLLLILACCLSTALIAQSKLVKTQSTGEFANVHCAVQDRNGNLWFGTTGEGIYQYNGSVFTNYTTEHGLPSNDVWSACTDKAGNVLFGTGDGISIYHPPAKGTERGTFTNLRIKDATKSTASEKNDVWSILQDKSGKYWFGSSHGVFCYEGPVAEISEDALVPFLQNPDIINAKKLGLHHIQQILEDKNGNFWFASWNQEGLIFFDGKTLTNYKPNGNGMVHAILEDREGTLWVGTRSKGIATLDLQQEENDVKTFMNFMDTGKLSKECIYTMTEDLTGTIWFVTESTGVWSYDPSLPTMNEALSNLTTDDGLCNNSVFSVIEDRGGILWFGARNTGLCSYDAREEEGNRFKVYND